MYKDLGIEDVLVEAHLYKMLIYQEGDFFLPHKDSEKEPGMFGTFVVELPSHYQGGELVISFEGEKVVADFSGTNDFNIHYTAFYADCDHEVKVVKAGYRICLVYNLVQKSNDNKIALKSIAQPVQQLTSVFTKHQTEQPYIILLGHQYTPENFSYAHLKLNDRYKAEALIKAAEKINYYAKLCLVTSFKSGLPEYDGHYSYGENGGDDDAVMVEVYDEWMHIEHWAKDGVPALSHLNFEENDLITSFALEDNEPIVKESTGYMGNYGPDLMHWYHYGAVVIWPSKLNAALLLQQNTTDQLKWIAHFTHTRQVSPDEVNAVSSILATGLNYDKYSDKTADYNAVINWLIFQNNKAFLSEVPNEKLLLFFKKADTAHWQKIWEWLPENSSMDILNKISATPDGKVLKKLLSVTRALYRSTVTTKLAEKQDSQLPDYMETLVTTHRLHLDAAALSDLFWIENNSNHNEEWVQKVFMALTCHTEKNYIHNTLAPLLLTIPQGSFTVLQQQLITYCKNYLQTCTANRPEPPKNWSRPLPETEKNSHIWQLLRPFMESPVEQVFDFRKNQSERTEVENAIAAEAVDLKTETIRRGTPHTLRITKTLAGYRQLLTEWEADMGLLQKLHNIKIL